MLVCVSQPGGRGHGGGREHGMRPALLVLISSQRSDRGIRSHAARDASRLARVCTSLRSGDL
jgi:hypothetical protein